MIKQLIVFKLLLLSNPMMLYFGIDWELLLQMEIDQKKQSLPTVELYKFLPDSFGQDLIWESVVST